MILYTDLSYIHPTRCYIYIKGYSIQYLVNNFSFEKIINVIYNEESTAKDTISKFSKRLLIEDIDRELGIPDYLDKILILNMEDCNGYKNKLNIIKETYHITNIDSALELALEICKKIIKQKIYMVKEFNKLVYENDINQLINKKMLSPNKNHLIELCRALYNTLIKHEEIEDNQILRIDREIRITKKLYPGIDIYLTNYLLTKTNEENVINLLTYAYYPLTQAYILQARKLKEIPKEIIYEGPIGLENLK